MDHDLDSYQTVLSDLEHLHVSQKPCTVIGQHEPSGIEGKTWSGRLRAGMNLLQRSSLKLGKIWHGNVQGKVVGTGAPVPRINEVLPDDVLGEIFVHALPFPGPYHCHHVWTPDYNCLSDSLDTKFAPWTLSYVCRRWRALVLSLPELWSEIGLKHFQRDNPRWDMMHHLLTLQLTRATSRPLFVSIAMGASKDEDQLDLNLVDLILPTADRWVALHLDLPVLSRFRLQSLEGKCLPLLHTLSIGRLWEGGLPLSLPYLKNAPRLRRILGSQNALHEDGPYELPLEQVIDFSQVSHRMFSRQVNPFVALHKLPNLQTARIYCGIGVEGANTHLTLPHLTSLNVRQRGRRKKRAFYNFTIPCERHTPRAMLERMTLPALTFLGVGGKMSSNTIIALQSRSHFAITSVAFDADSVNNMKSCVYFLKLTPSLTCVRFLLCEPRVIHRFCEELSWSPMLPNLRLLQLDCAPNTISLPSKSCVIPRDYRVEYLPWPTPFDL